MPKYTLELEKELVDFFRNIHDVDSIEIMLSKMLRLFKEVLEATRRE